MPLIKAPLRASFMGAATLLAVLGSIGSANAASFSIVPEPQDTTTTTLTSSFNPGPNFNAATFAANNYGIGTGTVLTTFSSANDGCGIPGNTCGNSYGLFLNPGNAVVTFTYLGHEASNTDFTEATLAYNNSPMFNNQTTSVGTSVSITETLGSGANILPFLFSDTSTNPDKVALNGGSIDPGISIGYYLVNPTTVYAFFDDTNGGNPDHDYDDMVVKITVSNTPLPAALPLFGSGLGVVGLLARRRKRKVAALAV